MVLTRLFPLLTACALLVLLGAACSSEVEQGSEEKTSKRADERPNIHHLFDRRYGVCRPGKLRVGDLDAEHRPPGGPGHAVFELPCRRRVHAYPRHVADGRR